ncbi:choice-of-anchor Q domain-containing protein [Tahibacter caeni]|uniref:choice-of-anchor Q domain-containing protein n=1 Tax=Tahibacter caeni TaxID=1453545 RepID=UPI002148A618|nr:choice-of-anchor Q domain-containing protein [Tahibacter caeni]
MLLRVSLLACAFVADPAIAADLAVTTAADGGPGSLRQAVAAANANPGADTISIGNVGPISLTAGTLLVTDDLTVRGTGGSQAVLSNAAAAQPVADFDPGRLFLLRGTVDRQIVVALQDLVLGSGNTHGTVDANGIVTDNGDGGAVRSEYADLTVAGCTFSANHSANDGGALWQYEGRLTVRDSLFSINAADFHGGAAQITGGQILLQRVRFYGNTAVFGGALATADTGTQLTVQQAHFDRNQAQHTGGAGYLALSSLDMIAATVSANVSGQPQGAGLYLVAPIDAPGTPMRIANSTFSGNGTPADIGASAGAGITLTGGRLQLRNSTVYGNPVASPGGPPLVGGGIFVRSGDNHLDMESVLVAAADVVREIEAETADNSIRARHSLIQTSPAPGTFNAGDSENLFDTDPLVAPLAANGGYAPTHAIAAGSPARDRGDNVYPLLPTDQRGVDSALGLTFHRYYDRPDVGAYEYLGEDTIFYADHEDH